MSEARGVVRPGRASSTCSCRSRTRSRSSSRSRRSRSARRSPSGRRTRRRSSPTCWRSSRRTSRRCRGSSRRSTRWPRRTPRTRRSCKQAVQVGLKVREMQAARRGGAGRAPGRLRPGRGEAVRQRPQPLRRQDPPVRDGRGADRQGDPRVLLRLRRAGDGGLRHDRDVDGRHRQHARGPPLRVGRQADPRRGGRRSPRTARCCCKGPNIFKGYYKNEEATAEALEDGWLHTGDLGSIDEDGFLFITGRKKDIIITAGGKNITPANLENGLKQNRWISQAVVIGDRRPYLIALITLDPEELAAFAGEHGLEESEVAGSGADARRGAGGRRRGERHGRPGRADQEVHDPARRPVARRPAS